MRINLKARTKTEMAMLSCAEKIIQKFNCHGYEAYIVGGAVRNILLNLPINDIDITTNALPEEMMALFDHTIPVGIEHGTVMIIETYPFEVTTFREEGDYTDHRRPDQVYFVSNLIEDLKRRDFTVNALALKNDEVIDYFNGIESIRLKQIKAVGNPNERFTEDALRMIRALRFMSQLSFHIECETLDAIYKNHALIEYVSIERIVIELKKLCQGEQFIEALPLFFKTKLYQFIPFFNAIDVESSDVLVANDFFIWIAKYCEQQPKLLTKLKALKLSNIETKRIKTYINIHHDIQQNKPIQMIIFHYSIDAVIKYIKLWDENNIFSIEYIQHQFEQLPIKDQKALVVNGNDLMQWVDQKGGPWLKEMMVQITNAVLLGELKNEKNDIKKWVKANV